MEVKLDASEPPLHVIVADGDLTFELLNTEQISPPPKIGPKTRTIIVARFKVKRATMINLPHWKQKNDSIFKVMLTGSFREAKQTVVQLEDDDATAFKIFVSVCHWSDLKDLFDCDHAIMWPLIKIFDKYNVDLKPAAEKWFAKWYESKGEKIEDIDAREMLYPCWRFDYAPGFLKASRACIYGVVRHINDKNPGGFKHGELRLPSRILQQLNTARGRLRSVIHVEIWKPARGLLNFHCPCDDNKSKNGEDLVKLLPSGALPPHTCKSETVAPCKCRYPTVGGYIRALERTRAWPLDDTWTKETANTILNRLDDFEYDRKVSSCPYCSNDFTQDVKFTVDMVRKYLDGLCLDCMRDSEESARMKANNVWDVMEGHHDNDPYWNRKRSGDWSCGCRVQHGEPTWYFSNLARKHEN